MKKHGFSHAIGGFISTISAVALSDLLRKSIPDIYSILFNFSSLIKGFIPFVSETVLVYTILASGIMFLWGVGFYFTHRDQF